MKITAEYIWIDGQKPTAKLRSKTKILDGPVKKVDEIPEWGYDGSSTYQATGHFSDLLLRPVKIVLLQDCGLVLNRLQAETQLVSAITQGIAQALLEYRQMDNLTGRMLNPNLEEYKLTHAREFPEIHVECFENPIGKVSGIGEPRRRGQRRVGIV